jgi:hypothetical protein
MCFLIHSTYKPYLISYLDLASLSKPFLLNVRSASGPRPRFTRLCLKKLGMKQKLRFSRKLGGLNWLANRHHISLG